MKVTIEIPEEYQKQFEKVIVNKDFKTFIEEHIATVINTVAPNEKGFWNSLFSWSK